MVRYTDNSAGVGHFTNCGHSIQKAPRENKHRYSRHFHESGELLLLISGNVQYSVDGKSYALKSYDVLLIPPYTYHFLIPISDDDYESYVINIRMDFAKNERLKKLFSPPYIINIANDSVLRRMFTLFDYYYENYTFDDFKEASDHLMQELLICLSYKTKRDVVGWDRHKGDTLITQITSYINENLIGELNADIIARHLNFSRSYVQNQFSEVMGIGLKQYINQKKIYAAHSDIQNGISPNEAAQKYGYADYSCFFRQYKKIFGVSPKSGRK